MQRGLMVLSGYADRLAGGGVLAIGYLSLTPLPNLPDVPGNDKLHHLVAYAVLTFLATLSRRKIKEVLTMPIRLLPKTTSPMIEVCGGSESWQHTNPQRVWWTGATRYRVLSRDAREIAALVCGFGGDERRARGLMMLRAYIDDSMEQGRVLVMGGFIATPERWERFSDEWRQRLEHAKWPVFKMNEVWARGSEEALEHAKWHYYTIRDHVQGAVAMVVPIEPLKRVVEKTGLTAISNPYIWAIKGIINLTAQHQTDWGVKGSIDFIFDERSEKRQVREGWEVYMATVPEKIRAVTGRDPIFENDERVLPLQAADMWA